MTLNYALSELRQCIRLSSILLSSESILSRRSCTAAILLPIEILRSISQHWVVSPGPDSVHWTGEVPFLHVRPKNVAIVQWLNSILQLVLQG
jgi:hypothetical protein